MLKITLITLGNKMPDWVAAGSQEYAKRFHEGVQVKIVELPLTRRNKNSDLARILEKEASLMKNAIPPGAKLIALDLKGISLSSEELAVKITQLQQYTSHLCFLIGGPEGLSAELLQLAEERWSLSKLTLPHPLVRILFLETLYRAWCIIHNHPYHK